MASYRSSTSITSSSTSSSSYSSSSSSSSSSSYSAGSSYVPVRSKYYHYLDDEIPWNKYLSFDLPYWTRFQDEYERLRSCLRGQETMLNEMSKISSDYDTTVDTCTYVPTSTYVEPYVPTYTPTISYCPEVTPYVPTYIPTTTTTTTTTGSYTEEVPMSRIETEISAWKSCVDDLASLLGSLKGRTDVMGNRIVGLLTDKQRTYILMEEFGIESILREMEEKRKRCEDYSTRIYDALRRPHYTHIEPVLYSNNNF